jgi:transposase
MTSNRQEYVNGVAMAKGQKTEYVERPVRRQFSREYKRRILAEAAASKGRGEVGALLRREGLYSSHLTKWRRQAARGELSEKGASERKDKSQAAEIAALRRENAKLAQQLEQARYIIDAQKKLSLALEQTLHAQGDKR